jgi:2-polyprenyl-6-methoxyphenol hydroxylase-like FAD-dependent oxidoreductase
VEQHPSAQVEGDTDVLIVGAGPTGLALAAQLRRFGVRFRLIDRSLDRTRESRALGVQARTLEILQTIGLGEQLAARGRRGGRVVLHFGGRSTPEIRLGDIGAADTRFPFILFVSQAETEALLGSWLEESGVAIERGVELVSLSASAGGVACRLRGRDGVEETLQVRHVAGCDGAHSVVRRSIGVAFEGDRYPQDFVLGDVRITSEITPDAMHAFAQGQGMAIFFPLREPAPWRVIAMDVSGATRDGGADPGVELTVEQLQPIVDRATGGAVRIESAAWLSRFRLHHRQAAHYRVGRIFLAGDAAHIHSPVGAQGMNTGIQDAWNLGWKLALVLRGEVREELLESYEAERWPVGHFLLRVTDRAFGLVTRFNSGGAVATWVRRVLVGSLMRIVTPSSWVRRKAFHFVSQLGIRYRRSPAVSEGVPRLAEGPRAGDRLPDARLSRDGQATSLHDVVSPPCFHLLLCGDATQWNAAAATSLGERYRGLVAVHRIDRRAQPGTLADDAGEVSARLGVRTAALYLVRPDGHIAFRSGGADLAGVSAYLNRWVTRPA